MMTPSRVIKCDLDRLSRVTFNGVSASKHYYKYNINALQYGNRNALTLKYNSINSSIEILNNVTANKLVSVPMAQYNRLMIVCQDIDQKSTVTFKYDMNTVYQFHFYNASGNTPKTAGNVQRNERPGVAAKAVAKRLPTVTELQQDKLVLKKGKYRFKTKAFGTKRSDFPRSQGSRLSRYVTIVDNRATISMKRKYSLKHKMLNYLLGKLGMSLQDLQAYFVVNRSVSSNSMNNFGNGVMNRLPHVLVSAGFCHNYFDANKLINSGCISINGLPVVDANYVIKVGDLIHINIQLDGMFGVKFKDHLSPAHLMIDGHVSQILVKSNLLMLNSFASDQDQQIDVGTYRQKLVGYSKDPLIALLGRFEPLIRNLSR